MHIGPKINVCFFDFNTPDTRTQQINVCIGNNRWTLTQNQQIAECAHYVTPVWTKAVTRPAKVKFEKR